jgi:hypothetical protein
MSHFQQHPAFFNKPIKLTEEEKKDPMSVIIDFFTDYNLSEVREIHQNIDHICLTSDVAPFDDPEERDNLLSFRDSEEKVMEAALILMETQSDNLASGITRQSKAEPVGQQSEDMDIGDIQKKVLHLQSELAELSKSLLKSSGVGLTLRYHKL